MKLNKNSQDLDKTKNQSYICLLLEILALILSASCAVVAEQVR